ncbi:hypothetical protein GLYMA_02G197752v4 [Glycine max]|nr:hypothetical protein GLYMA_02G197752v4 [Glycine max]KAH1061184.1 hypothetical protein GYH30_004601 [Glycine max]
MESKINMLSVMGICMWLVLAHHRSGAVTIFGSSIPNNKN